MAYFRSYSRTPEVTQSNNLQGQDDNPLSKFCHTQLTATCTLRIQQTNFNGCCIPTRLVLRGRLIKECLCLNGKVEPEFAWFNGAIQPPSQSSGNCDDLVLNGFGFRWTKHIAMCGVGPLEPDNPLPLETCSYQRELEPFSLTIDIPNDVLSDPNRPFRPLFDCGNPRDGMIDGKNCPCIEVPNSVRPDPTTGGECAKCQMDMATYRCLMANELCPSGNAGQFRRIKLAKDIIKHQLNKGVLDDKFLACDN